MNPLVGRREEQDALERTLTDARLGSSRNVVVSGEPGIGKTALLDWAAGRARAEGMDVLAARGVESEVEVPFGTLLELLRPAIDDVDRLSPSQAEALRSALDLGPAGERDRFVIGSAILNLLSTRSERTPLLVLIDDAHWVDDSSLAALVFAARRLLVDPVAVVFAARTGEAPQLEAARLPALPLAGLDSQAMAEIVLRHAADAPAPDVVERLERAAAGNPLALVELASRAMDVAAAPVEGPLEVRTSVAATYARRIEELPPRTRRILALAAAEQSGRLAWLSSAAEELGLELTELEPAEKAELVHIAYGTLSWRHPLVRSAAYGVASPDERRAANAALARALPAGEEDRRAWHQAAAAFGPDEAAAKALDGAGRRARSRSAYAAAATAAERAAQLSPGDEDRARRLLAAAEAAWLGGQAERALSRLREAGGLDLEPGLRAEVQYLHGQAMIRAGEVMAGQAELVDGAAAIDSTDPERAVVMLAEATEACVYGGRPEAMLDPARRAFALLGDESGERARFFANLALGMALIYTDHGDEGAGHLREAVAVLEASDVLSGDPRWLAAAALAPLWLRESHAGESLIDRAISVARAKGALGTLPFALMLAARDAATSDRWPIGRALYEEAIGLARETEQNLPLCGALAGLACVQARTGEEEACEAGAREALELGERHELGLFRVWALDALAELELGRGGLEPALGWLDEKRRVLNDLGLTDPDLSPVPERVEIAVRRGDADLGGDLGPEIEAFARTAQAKGQPWAEARAARTRGLVAGDGDFRRCFSEALELHEATPDRFEEARTALCFGERLRRAGQRVQAREQLRAALAGFEALGAQPWSARAGAELQATGERARRRDPSTLDDLTPQELQVGLVLAGGHTTREAAAKLFLSPKTVEYHLRNVYRKLGIHSREELAEALAGMDPPGAQDQVAP